MLIEVIKNEQPFHQGEMLDEYLNLIFQEYDGIGEKHHILPVCMYPEYQKSEWNLVKLTFENHYKAHELLPFIVKNGESKYKLLCAWNQMCGRTNGEFIDAKRYAELKTLFSENNPSKRPDVKAKKREKQKALWSNDEYRLKVSGENHYMYGKKWSQEQKDRLSASCMGRPSATKGTKKTEEVKDKTRGSKNHAAKAVLVDGVLYPTRVDAGKALGVSKHVIAHMLRTGRAVDAETMVPRPWVDGRKSGILIGDVEYKTMLEASETLGVTYTTLRNWIKKGKAVKIDYRKLLDTTKETSDNTQNNQGT